MDTSQTAAAYDAIADHWNGDDFNRENGISQHRRALRFCEEEGNAIDIGCGSSGRILDLLIESGFEAEGLDISAEMIRLARLRHPDVSFHHADIVDWDMPRNYDFISAWDSIWHVPLDKQPDVISKLLNGLSPGGVFITTSGGIDDPDEVTNPCHGQPLYHSALGIPKLLALVEANGCICRHLEYDQPERDGPGKHLCLIVQQRA